MARDPYPWDWFIAQLLQRRRLALILVLLVGVLLSTGVLLEGWRTTRQVIEAAYRRDASEYVETLREEIEEGVNGAASVADLFQTVGPVSQDQFRAFVLPHLTRCSPELLALVWVPRVPDKSRARFETAGRRQWGPAFHLVEGEEKDQARVAGRRTEYFPVYYRESLTQGNNSPVVGQDLAGAEANLEALQRARDAGGPAMTASIPLITGGKEVHVYWPIYRKGMPRDSVPDRRRALLGFVGAILRIDLLVESVIEESRPRGVEITLLDETGPGNAEVLYTRPARPDASARSWLGQRLIEARIRRRLHWTSALDVGGRRWAVTVTPTAGYVNARISADMWKHLWLGLVVTGFVGGYLFLLMRRTDAVERQVAARTQELQHAHDQLLAVVTERTRAEAVARRLTQQVLSVQEEERRRLSRELHDEAGQSLTGLVLNLQLLQADIPADQAALRQRLREAGAVSRGTAERIRLLARDLRPPALDALGLNASLRGLCHEIARRTDVTIDYTGSEVGPLPDTSTICLYRVLQEALTNFVKHAGARQVRVVLQDDAETIHLAVEDDGLGSNLWAVRASRDPSRGIWLLGMQERLELLGGRLEIVSWPGQGTRLVAHIPVMGAESLVGRLGSVPGDFR